jgi:hypothetical protein
VVLVERQQQKLVAQRDLAACLVGRADLAQLADHALDAHVGDAVEACVVLAGTRAIRLVRADEFEIGLERGIETGEVHLAARIGVDEQARLPPRDHQLAGRARAPARGRLLDDRDLLAVDPAAHLMQETHERRQRGEEAFDLARDLRMQRPCRAT